MAVTPMYCKISYKDHLLTQKAMKQSVRDFTCHYTAIIEGCRCFSSVSTDAGRRWLNDATDIFLKTNARKTAGCRRPHCHLIFRSDNASSQRDNVHNIQLASESSSNELQLRSLDSYFRKLQNDFNQPSSDFLNKNLEFSDKSGQFKAKNLLGSLDDYLGKVNGDPKTKNYVSSTSAGGNTEASYSVREDTGRGRWKKIKNYMKLEDKDGQGGPESSYDETSDLYLISILVSINIAVFLFEIASPVRNSDLELFSLPLMYGAKINHLIKIGQWWRLLTPMFLHSGILHVALSCWVLLTFGPRVCGAYGSFTFFLIYLLGGISGNLTSFLHTPEPTVGGTGPIFAVIGAWLVYQIQNKDVTAKDVSESMFQKAVIATALSFTLSNLGPIDDWAHFGAAFAGILYGILVCPTLQMEDTSKAGQEEGIALVRRRYADPCKSLLVFSLFVLLLSCLFFVIEPPLYSGGLDTFE